MVQLIPLLMFYKYNSIIILIVMIVMYLKTMLPLNITFVELGQYVFSTFYHLAS